MCGECNKNFSQKESLNAHIKGVHEGIKFPCDECPYKATTSLVYLDIRKGNIKANKFCVQFTFLKQNLFIFK